MRAYDAATRAALNTTAIVARPLIWIRARDRDTGLEEAIGLWTGEDHQDFVIRGDTRTYYGAGTVLGIDPITYQTGISVRTQRITLSAISEEVAVAIRGYEPRHAPVEIHRALFDPAGYSLIAEPHRLFAGYIDRLTINTAAIGGQSSVEMSLASSARSLTVPLNRRRSDESLRARSPGDAFRQYATVAATVAVKWGGE